MKYIKKFKHEEDFNAFKDSDKYVTPNVSYIHGVEKSKLRRNVKFKIKDKECNAGADMTWEEWSKQANVEFFGNQDYKTDDGKVFNTDSLYVYKNLPTYELKENTIIPQHIYDLYDDPDKVIFYTSTDGNIVKPHTGASYESKGFDGAKIVSNEYKDGLGRIVFDKKITALTEVVVGYSGVGPFYQKTTLESIWLPDSVTSIIHSTFKACANLKNVNSLGNITSIPSSLFYQCSKLETVNIPPTVLSIGGSAFSYCTNLLNIIGGINIGTIGTWAFQNCTSLCHIDLGKKLTTINPEAFQNCTNLASIIMPDTIDEIADNAFNGCTALPVIDNIKYADKYLIKVVDKTLQTYNIKPGTVKIGPSAFADCKKLTNIILPNSIKHISGSAFRYCNNLKVSLPTHIKSIGHEAFNSTQIEEIILPDTLVTLGDSAFIRCQNAKTIKIGTGLTEIPYNAFWNCSNVTDLIIGPNVTTIGGTCFMGLAITSVTIPDSVVNLSPSAFYACQKIQTFYGKFASSDNRCLIQDNELLTYAFGSGDEYTISDNITSLNSYAFRRCSTIKNVTLGENVELINNYAFERCKALTNIILNEKLTTINTQAFDNCTSLTSITLPNSLINFGSSVFNECTNLSAFYGAHTSNDHQLIIVDNEIKFALCKNYKEYTIPEGIVSIGDGAFIKHKTLTNIVLPSTLTNIGSSAFTECKLTSIEIPDSVLTIGASAFKLCAKVTELVIPDNVTTIGEAAFFQMVNLQKLVFGKGLVSLGDNPVGDCHSLKTIISHNPIAPSVGYQAFRDIATDGVLYYPFNSDYSEWLSTKTYHLGSYNWTGKELYTPTEYYDLAITANDVDGRTTKTSIYWTCMSNGVHTIDGTPITGIQLSGTAVSNEFPQNLSETDTVEREITFEYQGLTATTTITQGVWIPEAFTVILNDNWEKSTTIVNPDEDLYDGVYQSFSNKGIKNTAATMYIDIIAYKNFKFYIRSYGESSYDYVMVSQLDTDINNNTSYSDTSLVKAHTRSNQQSGTAISNYTLVEFTGLDEGAHRITIVYRKDPSGDSGDDRGYVLIPFEQ